MGKNYEARKKSEVTRITIVTTSPEDPNWVPPFHPEEDEYHGKRGKY